MPYWILWAISSVFQKCFWLSLLLLLWPVGKTKAGAISWWHSCHAPTSGHKWTPPMGISTVRMGMHPWYLTQQKVWLSLSAQSALSTRVPCIAWVTCLALAPSCLVLVVAVACIHFSCPAALPHCADTEFSSPFRVLTDAPMGSRLDLCFHYEMVIVNLLKSHNCLFTWLYTDFFSLLKQGSVTVR